MNRKNKTQLIILLCSLVAAIGSLIYVSYGSLGDNLVYYLTPSEILARRQSAYGAVFRLGGVVAPQSIEWDEKNLKLQFKVADNDKEDAQTVIVRSQGAPPQMFREKIGVVVEGRFEKDNVFYSDRVIVNHSNEYQPPQDGQAEKNHGTHTISK